MMSRISEIRLQTLILLTTIDGFDSLLFTVLCLLQRTFNFTGNTIIVLNCRVSVAVLYPKSHRLGYSVNSF